MEKRALRTAFITADNVAYQSIGSQIPTDMRRYVYRIKTTNHVAGPNMLYLARGPAAAEVVIDHVQEAVEHGIWNDPDDLNERSVPIYIFEAEDEFIRCLTDNGDMDVFIIYIDEP